MASLSEEPEVVKFVLQNGVGLHTTEANPDVLEPRWQQQQFSSSSISPSRLKSSASTG